MTEIIGEGVARRARAGRKRIPAAVATCAEEPAPPVTTAPTFPPVSGYIATRADWNPAVAPWNAWNPRTRRQAETDLAYFKAIGAEEGEYVLVRVDITYTVVKGGTR